MMDNAETWRPKKKRLKDNVKEPPMPSPGWHSIIRQFTPKDGDVLLIQYAQGHEPELERLQDISQEFERQGKNITLLLLPGDLCVQHIPVEKVGELLDVLIELAEKAMGDERYGKAPNATHSRAVDANQRTESEY